MATIPAPAPNSTLSLLPQRIRRLWYLSIVGSLLLVGLFAALHEPLKTDAARQGIISYEFARTQARAAEILASWTAAARLRAAFGLGLDYLFMVSYATAIGLGCVVVAAAWRGWPARLGRRLAWAVVLAALLDAVENVALWQQLLHGAAGCWALLAWFCASIKFALVTAGLLYILGGSLIIWKGGRV
jgi:hypothetical protein